MKKIFVLSFSFLISLLANAFGDESANMAYDRTETTVKSFPATASTSVEIINKYGDITVNTWNKDSVKFEITITAGAQKLSTAQTLFEMAEVKYTATSSMILATLQWGNNVNAFKRSTVEVSLAAGSGQVLRIDYVVYLPENNTLKIENRFGNIWLPALTGKTYISLWHGDLKADKIKNAKNINVKYGDVDMNELTEGELNVSFGDIMIEDCGEVFIDATSGTIEIEKAMQLNIEASNAKIRIEEVEEMMIDALLSDIKIRKLKKKLDVQSKMGDVHVSGIDANFTNVVLDVSNGNISLEFDEKSNFLFTIDIEKPKTIVNDASFVFTDDDKLDIFRNIDGKKGESTVEKLRITGKSCGVNLDVKGN